MRAFEVVNGSGFDFTVYPDRGLDIGPARYNGLPLTWTTRNGPVAPAFYDASGFEWLRTWAGGLLTTCGWLNVGGPCTTPEGAQGLHGRMDHTRPFARVRRESRDQSDGHDASGLAGRGGRGPHGEPRRRDDAAHAALPHELRLAACRRDDTPPCAAARRRPARCRRREGRFGMGHVPAADTELCRAGVLP